MCRKSIKLSTLSKYIKSIFNNFIIEQETNYFCAIINRFSLRFNSESLKNV